MIGCCSSWVRLSFVQNAWHMLTNTGRRPNHPVHPQALFGMVLSRDRHSSWRNSTSISWHCLFSLSSLIDLLACLQNLLRIQGPHLHTLRLASCHLVSRDFLTTVAQYEMAIAGFTRD